MMRTFIAIEFSPEFSPEVHQQLASTCHALRQYLQAHDAPDGLRWVSMETIHLTLRFLGETTQAQTERLAARLQEIANRQQPFKLALAEIGGFPNVHQPRVLWMGLGGNLTQLNTIQAAIAQCALEMGFAPEKLPYMPHITLARAQRRATDPDLRSIGKLLQAHLSPKYLSPKHLSMGHQRTSVYSEEQIHLEYQINGFVHMESQLQRRGVVYQPVARFRFGG